MMFKTIFVFFLTFLSYSVSASTPLLSVGSEHDFIKSFLKHFEFSPEGRYVHEYHPFILQQTSESFRLLEKELVRNDLNLHGRFAILGYEEASMPPYYTDFKAAKINDEATTKNNAGWSLKLHNRFGFMTGFTLKDVNRVKSSDQIFEHINVDKISLFDARAGIFQEHAFGEALPLIDSTHQAIMKVIKNNEYRKVLSLLIKFWEKLYGGYLKVGNKQVAGTQDILFSVEGAKHLLASPVPLKKYFTGPDITYPIEIFNSQQKGATRHAQVFVERFAQQLVPQNGEKTVYIFCSFVDGVGKSTMLGNIKNWMKYGNNVEHYEHVDNSSSQLAEVFQFHDKVYIADLPAQMSHFTYKPDGLVFVDINTEKRFFEKLDTIQSLVRKDAVVYENKYETDLISVRNRIHQSGFFDPSLQNVATADKAFLRNLVLLKKDYDNYWIPFSFEGEYFLFNRDNYAEIRCLQPLADVKSEGLKNIKSEQMLFFNGVRFPLPYKVFMDDLVNKFKEQGIKQVIFVDFLSMYPRSSRENIRVNYLLQQLALIDTKFDVHNSIYHDFVSGGELLYSMQTRSTSQKISEALELETLVRLYLHKLIVERGEGDLTGIGVEALTVFLQKHLESVVPDLKKFLRDQVTEKSKKELIMLEKIYGRSKSYVNVQLLSLKQVCVFSSIMQDLFANHIENDRLKALWEDIGEVGISEDKQTHGLRDQFIMSSKGVKLYECFSCLEGCKDEFILRPMLRFLRASWYATLGNLLFTHVGGRDELTLKNELFMVAPCVVKQSPDGVLHAVQPVFEAWEGKLPPQVYDIPALFNVPVNSSYGSFMDGIYRLDWDSRGTDSGVFAFDFMSEDRIKKTFAIPSITTKVVNKYQADYGVATVMPTSELCTGLEKNSTWGYQHGEAIKEAERNGQVSFVDGTYSFEGKPQKQKEGDEKASRAKKTKKKLLISHPAQHEGARLLIRLLATLEMIAKDPEASGVIRPGNRDDFVAAIKMIESITMPKSFNVMFMDRLFEDYDSIEPYPSWEFWDKI